MSSEAIFPSLDGWEPTRETLHWYAKAVGVVPRAHAPFHPRWWHISLKLQPDGLTTDRMPLPAGGTFWLVLDLRRHQVVLDTSQGILRTFSMQEGLSATALGERLLGALAELGLSAEYQRAKFANDEARAYDPVTAERFLGVLTHVERIFQRHRAGLPGEVGPVQLWPHGFDMSFEWFGTRLVEHVEGGQVQRSPAQLNLGFSPGEASYPEPYFYSNPWPFEADRLLGQPLPPGARWFTESWQGSLLPYRALAGDPQAEDKLLAYARAVYQIAAPTLSANS